MSSNQTAFEASLRELIATAAAQPGRLHAEVLRGSRNDTAHDHHIVYRFTDRTSLRAREASPTRKRKAVILVSLTACV